MAFTFTEAAGGTVLQVTGTYVSWNAPGRLALPIILRLPLVSHPSPAFMLVRTNLRITDNHLRLGLLEPCCASDGDGVFNDGAQVSINVVRHPGHPGIQHCGRPYHDEAGRTEEILPSTIVEVLRLELHHPSYPAHLGLQGT